MLDAAKRLLIGILREALKALGDDAICADHRIARAADREIRAMRERRSADRPS